MIGGLTLAVTFAASAREPVDYVNPFIGAASTRPTKDELARLTAAGVKLDPNFEGFHGKLFPGAATPAGMVQLSPDTITGGDNGGGYSYPHTTIQGFSFNHMSGVGCVRRLGQFHGHADDRPAENLAMARPTNRARGYLSSYDKETEVAQPGYYAVTLDDYKVRAEMTAAPAQRHPALHVSEKPAIPDPD